jgi:hypothetical protein
MRCDHPASHLALALLLGVGSHALASQDGIGVSQQPQKMRIDNRIETEYTVTLEAESQKDYCHAKAEFEWWQDNTVAHVEGAITNPDCGASSGTYTVSVRHKELNGEVQRNDYEENWSREDDQPFSFVHDYEIGENVDLIRVSARKVVCICAGQPVEDEQPVIKGEQDE